MPQSPENLAALDHATLYRMRGQTKDPTLQDLLAAYEHRAFAREATAENPYLSVPIALAAPLYQLAKLAPQSLTGMRSRTSPSWGQLGQGLLGVGEGLISRWK